MLSGVYLHKKETRIEIVSL